jgi:hypothetical protein
LNRRGKRKKGRAVVLKGSLFVAALLVLPFTVALLLHLPELFGSYERITREMLFCSGGFLFFIILFLLFGPPVKTYIIEHELSHLLFALLSGVGIKKVVIRKNEGYVRTQKVNLIIALAPYSFPLYTLVVFILYRVVALFSRSVVISSIFYILEQPDLKRYGYFPSLILISTWSLCVISLVLALLFERVQALLYFKDSFMHGIDFYLSIVRYFFA